MLISRALKTKNLVSMNNHRRNPLRYPCTRRKLVPSSLCKEFPKLGHSASQVFAEPIVNDGLLGELQLSQELAGDLKFSLLLVFCFASISHPEKPSLAIHTKQHVPLRSESTAACTIAEPTISGVLTSSPASLGLSPKPAVI